MRLYDFYASKFGQAPHLKAVCEKIEATIGQRDGRLVVYLPPGHAKTSLFALALPAWYAQELRPGKVGYATHNAEIAQLIGRNFVNLHKGFYAPRGYDCIERGAFEMRLRSVGGSTMGSRWDLLVFDDLISSMNHAKSRTVIEHTKEWLRADFFSRSRLHAPIVGCTTRWCKDDLHNFFAKEGFEIMSLPAMDEDRNVLWPERYDSHELDKIRESCGEEVWQALYQQEPIA